MFTGANGAIIATEKKLPSILVDETSVSVANSFFILSSAAFCCCIFLRSAKQIPVRQIPGAKDSGSDTKYWSCLQVLHFLG